MNLNATLALLRAFKASHPTANKAALEAELVAKAHLRKERSIYIGDGFALRFCEANTPSFSNVVLSLSALQRYDAVPVVICIVRPNRVEFRLANATFLRRISHSSHTLRTDNIRGSFLGHDIMDQYEEMPNLPEYFEDLFAMHREFTWEENVVRLVEGTNAIIARSTRFDVTPAILPVVLEAPARAAAAIATAPFRDAERRLSALIERHRDELLRAATLDNLNIRGNTIEQIITGEVNAHRLDDLSFGLTGGAELIVDIKTKLLDRGSAPKAYNIDKMLHLLARRGSVFALFFVGLDAANGALYTRLVSIFDPIILGATRIQTHWAGRASRGVTQLSGDLSRMFDGNFRASVDVRGGQALLKQFIER
jgi:hypothetical protein